MQCRECGQSGGLYLVFAGATVARDLDEDGQPVGALQILRLEGEEQGSIECVYCGAKLVPASEREEGQGC